MKDQMLHNHIIIAVGGMLVIDSPMNTINYSRRIYILIYSTMTKQHVFQVNIQGVSPRVPNVGYPSIRRVLHSSCRIGSASFHGRVPKAAHTQRCLA